MIYIGEGWTPEIHFGYCVVACRYLSFCYSGDAWLMKGGFVCGKELGITNPMFISTETLFREINTDHITPELLVVVERFKRIGESLKNKLGATPIPDGERPVICEKGCAGLKYKDCKNDEGLECAVDSYINNLPWEKKK